MLLEHRRSRPRVDQTAWNAPNALVAGSVTVGPGARVLYGAVLTAASGAQITVGSECVIMEQAVVRAAGRFSTSIGDHVFVGPHADVSGATVSRPEEAPAVHEELNRLNFL